MNRQPKAIRVPIVVVLVALFARGIGAESQSPDQAGTSVSLQSMTPAVQKESDSLDEALLLVNMRRADLGWKPKGWWPRFPDVPYKLRAFDALFARPFEAITFTRALGKTAWEMLDPDELDKAQGYGSRNLFRAVQRLGIDPKFGGFRGYTANLNAPAMPLDQAILKLTESARRPTQAFSFGAELPYPKLEQELAEKVRVLPEGSSPILGKLVLNIADAPPLGTTGFSQGGRKR